MTFSNLSTNFPEHGLQQLPCSIKDLSNILLRLFCLFKLLTKLKKLMRFRSIILFI